MSATPTIEIHDYQEITDRLHLVDVLQDSDTVMVQVSAPDPEPFFISVPHTVVGKLWEKAEAEGYALICRYDSDHDATVFQVI